MPDPTPGDGAEPGGARISFYVLEAPDPGARLVYACRLAEKVYKLRQRIHAHVGSPAEAEALDDLLWTFRQGSFVPHEVLGEGKAPTTPVTIGTGEPPDADVLINLTAEVPAFVARFSRVAEIVDGTPESRGTGRARHRWYRDHGLEPETHTVS